MPSRRKKLRLDTYLPYRLSATANAVSQLIARAYEDRFGLTVPQWRLLAVLADEGALTQQALCGRTVMDKVTVTRAAAALLRRKLVDRRPNPDDGRSHWLTLSAAGWRLHAEVAPLALQFEAALLQGFDPAQVRRFELWLRQLMDRAMDLKNGLA